MAASEGREWEEDLERWRTVELGSALTQLGRQSAAAECRWLRVLAEFDRRQGWALDGQLSGRDWLVWRCGLSARTSRDKLAYCKVRAITRITDVDDETDEWLIRLGQAGTVADLDRVVRRWQSLAEQERGLDDYLARFERRAVTASRTYDGMMVLQTVVPIEEGEEVLGGLDSQLRNEPVDDGSCEPPSIGQRRADALVALVRGTRSGAERYTLNLVADVDVVADRFGPERAELGDGTPVGAETLRRLACDCGIVRHLLRGRSEPLDVGRRTAVWTVAQRRAISVRDGGCCRFPRCARRTTDIHHVRHFGDGGPTAVNNGALLCPRHHTAVHEAGFTLTGEANGPLTFHRPDGSVLGTS